MRKGARCIPWTTEDDRYLMESAGTVPLREICRHLKRSRSAVKTRASRLKINLRTYERLTVICPKCGQARAKSGEWTGRTGFCQVCARRDAYREALWRQAEAFEALPPEARSAYDATQSRTGSSRLPPKPSAPAVSADPPARAVRVRELYDIDVEKWELRCLKLLTDACKKRTERMRAVIGANPRKGGASVDSVNEGE